MPTFKLNKLVRDKLPAIYESIGQKAKLKLLSKGEHATALIDKIIEEANELRDASLTREKMVSEVADVQQALDDYKSLNNINDDEVAKAQQAKNDEKGGFSQGAYIETLELNQGDTWIDYYRESPETYPELDK